MSRRIPRSQWRWRARFRVAARSSTTNPEAAKTALRSHRLYTKDKLPDDVFELSYSTIAPAMPAWGNMTPEGWQKVINFSVGAGIVKDQSKAPSNKEGVLWTNQYVGKP